MCIGFIGNSTYRSGSWSSSCRDVMPAMKRASCSTGASPTSINATFMVCYTAYWWATLLFLPMKFHTLVTRRRCQLSCLYLQETAASLPYPTPHLSRNTQAHPSMGTYPCRAKSKQRVQAGCSCEIIKVVHANAQHCCYANVSSVKKTAGCCPSTLSLFTNHSCLAAIMLQEWVA